MFFFTITTCGKIHYYASCIDAFWIVNHKHFVSRCHSVYTIDRWSRQTLLQHGVNFLKKEDHDQNGLRRLQAFAGIPPGGDFFDIYCTGIQNFKFFLIRFDIKMTTCEFENFNVTLIRLKFVIIYSKVYINNIQPNFY